MGQATLRTIHVILVLKSLSALTGLIVHGFQYLKEIAQSFEGKRTSQSVWSCRYESRNWHGSGAHVGLWAQPDIPPLGMCTAQFPKVQS